MMSVCRRVLTSREQLNQIVQSYANTGDWHGCLRNAIASLDMCLGADPPGKPGGIHEHEKARRGKWAKPKPVQTAGSGSAEQKNTDQALTATSESAADTPPSPAPQ